MDNIYIILVIIDFKLMKNKTIFQIILRKYRKYINRIIIV